MNMSKACLPPIQPTINEADKKHPLFNEYQRHRASMSAQLVQADSFDNWLFSRDMMAEGKRVCNHPRHSEYVVWLRNNVNCKPQKCAYKIIWQWAGATK